MGKRDIQVQLKSPLSIVASPAMTDTMTCFLCSSSGDTAFPQEQHHCAFSVHHEMHVVAGPGSSSTKIDENGETDLSIKWKRTYAIDISDFSIIKQATLQTCWAAAVTVMASYRDQVSYTIDQVMKTLDNGVDNGDFSRYYHDGGQNYIYSNTMDILADRLGLQPIPVTDLSGALLFYLLKNQGPLLIFLNVPDTRAGHFIVLYRVEDDGNNCEAGYVDVALGHSDTMTLEQLRTDFFQVEGWGTQAWGFGLKNRGTITADGEGNTSVTAKQGYHNQVTLPDGTTRNFDASEDFPRAVSLTIGFLVKPGCESPDPEDVRITLSMNQFPDMGDPDKWSRTMDVDGNDTVINPAPP